MNQSWKLISSPINEQPDAISFGGKVEISRTNLLGANRLRAGEDIKILTLENLAILIFFFYRAHGVLFVFLEVIFLLKRREK